MQLYAQTYRPKIKYGDVKAADFEPVAYAVDSTAAAIYLFDVGASYYEGNNTGGFSVIFKRHARIRLMNKNGFDMATVQFRVFKGNNFEDKLEDIDAATYNIEDGKVKATKLEKSAIFKDKNEDATIYKFTFPNIKEGSIIEFSYKVSSPSEQYLEPWYFQGEYPRLWSQYSVTVPALYDYVTLTQGYVPTVLDSSDVFEEQYRISDPGTKANERSENYVFTANTLFHTWGMQNVPAIKEEAFTTTLANHISKVEFQLSKIRYPNAPVKPVMSNWVEMGKSLMEDESFGEPLRHDNNWLNDDIKQVVAGAATKEEKARRIFAYVRDNFTCTDNYARYLSQPLKKTMQAKKGNVADINILLAAMLKHEGMDAYPVLLSTRGHGVTYDLYPIMNKFNYVITQVVVDNKQYLLDAADPDNAFNILGDYCYNGSARVITDVPYIISLSADSLKENKVTTVFVMNGEDNKLSAAFNTQLGRLESTEIRKRLSSVKEDEFFRDIKKAYPMEVELLNPVIDSLYKTEEPVAIKYELEFAMDEDLVYFSPILAEAQKENPFKSAERLYPVEMPACISETYILNMEIPKGYTIDELPKSAKVMLNESDGMFEYMISASKDRIQLRCRTVLNKANFAPEDYQALRDFFAFVVNKQSEQIVFKKNN